MQFKRYHRNIKKLLSQDHYISLDRNLYPTVSYKEKDTKTLTILEDKLSILTKILQIRNKINQCSLDEAECYKTILSSSQSEGRLLLLRYLFRVLLCVSVHQKANKRTILQECNACLQNIKALVV